MFRGKEQKNILKYEIFMAPNGKREAPPHESPGESLGFLDAQNKMLRKAGRVKRSTLALRVQPVRRACLSH